MTYRTEGSAEICPDQGARKAPGFTVKHPVEEQGDDCYVRQDPTADHEHVLLACVLSKVLVPALGSLMEVVPRTIYMSLIHAGE